ncbi:hypothetical protein [Trinickia diaoshuihuensis]|uniref:hypothetical protein n=1 Tax=Trinickia diaoshuihuensis TaxID=2292265 RepID=UPI000E2642E8|nr:hypothetical protein [Trinickia diaoshuihuensis]
MENTLQASGAAEGMRREAGGVELTAAGRLLIVALIAAVGFGCWLTYQRYDAGKAPGAPVRAGSAHTPSNPAISAGGGTSGASIGSESAVSKLAQLTDTLQQERAVRSAQETAWRAMADTSRQQLAVLSSQLQAVESKISALERTAPVPRAPREEVADIAASARAVRAAMESAKSTAQVDVASLPVETATAQSLNLTGLGNGVVQLGTQKLAVGQALTPGETIVAVDPVSRSIVTNRRILNVTN